MFPKSITPMRRAIYFASPAQIPSGIWTFRYFRPEELVSKGNGGLLLDFLAIERLDRFRAFLGAPIIVTSAYRDLDHNHRVGSQPTSLHPQGRAFDITSPGLTPPQLMERAKIFGWPGIGLYRTFVHVDDASPRTWGLTGG